MDESAGVEHVCAGRGSNGRGGPGTDKAQKSELRNLKVEGICMDLGSHWFSLLFPFSPLRTYISLTFIAKQQNWPFERERDREDRMGEKEQDGEVVGIPSGLTVGMALLTFYSIIERKRQM